MRELKTIFFLIILFYSSASVWSQDASSVQKKTTDTLPVFNTKNSPKVEAIISYAKTFMGTPYQWGGTTPSGFDCSGFINYIFGNFGFQLTRTSYNLAELGETIKLNDLQPGDLMFFRGSANGGGVAHVAMVIEVSPDAIRFIHSSTSRGVTVDNFKTSKYYISRYVKAKRLDYGAAKH